MFTNQSPHTAQLQRRDAPHKCTQPQVLGAISCAGNLQLIAVNYALSCSTRPLRHSDLPACATLVFVRGDPRRTKTNRGARVERRGSEPFSRSSPQKKEKALEYTSDIHARASAAIDESRLIGRYCLKGFQRPLREVAPDGRERKRPEVARGSGGTYPLQQLSAKRQPKKGKSRR